MVRTVLGGRGGRKGPLPSGQGPPPRHRGWNRLPEPPACSAASGRGERPVLPAPPRPHRALPGALPCGRQTRKADVFVISTHCPQLLARGVAGGRGGRGGGWRQGTHSLLAGAGGSAQPVRPGRTLLKHPARWNERKARTGVAGRRRAELGPQVLSKGGKGGKRNVAIG